MVEKNVVVKNKKGDLNHRKSPARRFAASTNIVSPSRPLSKSTVPATRVARPEKNGQGSSESVITFRAPQRLDLYVIAQHQFLGVGM